ncbi:MAG: hypothetical protein AAFO07_26770 [Bacteroidota bacterium]
MNTILISPTPDINESRNFYQKLGFTTIGDPTLNLFSDGKVVIEVNTDRFIRAGIKLYQESWEKEVKLLQSLTTVILSDGGYLLSDVNGTWIYLINGHSPIQEIDPTITPSILGKFAGLSLESIAFEQSIKIWESLNFKIGQGSKESGWITLENRDKMSISIMNPMSCPHLFFNPSLTYFNGGNNLENIAKIRKQGISITEEITIFNKEGIVDNVIVRDPGGYGFFVFND